MQRLFLIIFCIFYATFKKPADPNSKKNQPDADPDADLIKNHSKKLKICQNMKKSIKNNFSSTYRLEILRRKII